MPTPSTGLLAAFAAVACAPALRAQTPDQDHAAQNVFAQVPWRELGPVTSGGRIVDIAVHPTRPQVFWVAAASGGLWKTTNGGFSFEPQFQQEASISIGDIAVAPSDGDVLWVGTGESNNQRSSYWGHGVYKSTDGGKTFAPTGLDGTDHIGRIVVHPTDPNVVYVAALGALYTPNDTRGLYKTTDGGTSWQRVHHIGRDTGHVDVLLHPQQPDTVFTATYERRRRAWHFTEGGEGSRLWKSTDAGATWQQLAGGLPQGVLGRIGLDAFAADGNVLYATIENLNPTGAPPAAATPPAGDEREPRAPEASAEVLADPLAAAEFAQQVEAAQDPERRPRKKVVGGEVWRSDDAGAHWKKVNGSTEVGGNPGYYYGQIRVDPSERDTVYVLGVPVYRSTDGGKTWTPRRGERAAFAQGLHVDHHALWIDPASGKHALLGNDGGLAVTWDGGEHWDHVATLPILQSYTIAADLRTPYRVYTGLQDNGTWGFPVQASTSGGLTPGDAYRVDGGDGFHVCIDPNDPDVLYTESQFGGMSRQNLRTGERKGIKPKARKGEQPLRFNWSTPIVLSPHNPHTVWVGSQFVHRSRDRGDSWTTVSPDLTTNDAERKKGNVPHCTITTLAESSRQEGWLWVGTDDGRVHTSKDGGLHWIDLTDRFPAAVRGLWVSRVAASPHAAATAFVAFTGYREDLRAPFVFRTDDGGDTWLPIAHDLPQESVNVVCQHPRNEHVLLVGTDGGAYVSCDDGAHWFRLGNGMPRAAVHDLIVHARESHVLVGTHGRGVFALDAAMLEGLRAEHLGKAFHALPPSDGVLLRRGFGKGNVGARGWTAANPFTAPTFRYLLGSDSEAKVTIEVKDAAGKVLWSQDGPDKAGYHEVAWQTRGGGGRGGGGGGNPFAGLAGGGRGGVRAGQFAVTLKCGAETATFAFRVHDRRGTSTLLGANPGRAGDEDEEEDADAGEGETGR